ncbi:sugar ABC transporter ATP-binding protein [Deinococcus oregonensis]|uniref:Sugar ABC transporter ATP-binding protein n=1 Tax=Deinococcus oregonensis TaxID=1805970 RepID=A0ABV6AV77_9DEIO
MRNLTKRFPGVLALDSVDLDLAVGETHILLGENGAGKSTLVKLLSGVYAPDAGEMRLTGTLYRPSGPRAAMQAGVRLIHQELNLISNLSIAENLLFESLPHRSGLLNRQQLGERAQALLAQVGLNLSPWTSVERLSVAQMQQVEIAKALSGEGRLLILDEPTASLTSQETGRLFEILDGLKQRGVTVIYISHRLQEVFEIGDRYTVLRNGRLVQTAPLAGLQVSDLVRLMVGRDLEHQYPEPGPAPSGAPLLRVEGLRPHGSAHPVSFGVRAGEVLGIAGLVGAGRTEAVRAMFGADPKAAGQVFLRDQPLSIRSPQDAVQAGLSFVTENRKEEGLALDLSCAVNITLADLQAVTRGVLVDVQAEHRVAEQFVERLSVKTPSVSTSVRQLSGGNQQKIVLAKWLMRGAEVLMVDEPTRGIDVGARFEIYEVLHALAAEGKAVLVVSSDLPELMGLCHRIVVFSNGQITGEVARPDFQQEHILALAYAGYVEERTLT